MNTRTLYAIIGVIAIVIIGLLIFNQSNDNNDLASNSQNTNSQLNTNDTDNSNTATITPTGK